MADPETVKSVIEQLNGVAKELCALYGYSSVQINACMLSPESDMTTSFFAGSGSIAERESTTREFIERVEEIRKLNIRKMYNGAAHT